tara:strand:- start:69 stop:773 length:705 start_codon:yes stop_codon:yes gene_type:complete
MNKKHFYLIVDTETTNQNLVADFGAVVVDRGGKVWAEFGALLDDSDFHFALGSKKKVQAKYERLMELGYRCDATVAYINNWLNFINKTFNPTLTAYNIGFDMGKCRNTGIDLDQFTDRFCLLKLAKSAIVETDEYAEWAHSNMMITVALGKPSAKADAVAKYLAPDLPDEPHTALEDARDYEALILDYCINSPRSRAKILKQGSGTYQSKWCWTRERWERFEQAKKQALLELRK